MNKKLLLSSGLLALAIAFGACATAPKIQFDAVTDYDFARGRTYSLIKTDKGTPNLRIGPGVIQAAREGLTAALQAKGLTEASPADADLLVAMYLEMTDKVDVDDFGYGYGNYRGYGYRGVNRGGAYPGGGVTVTEYTDTVLAIDLIDNATHQLVWRGWASKNIYGDTKGNLTAERRQMIKDVIASVLANYPPPPTQVD